MRILAKPTRGIIILLLQAITWIAGWSVGITILAVDSLIRKTKHLQRNLEPRLRFGDVLYT